MERPRNCERGIHGDPVSDVDVATALALAEEAIASLELELY